MMKCTLSFASMNQRALAVAKALASAILLSVFLMPLLQTAAQARPLHHRHQVHEHKIKRHLTHHHQTHKHKAHRHRSYRHWRTISRRHHITNIHRWHATTADLSGSKRRVTVSRNSSSLVAVARSQVGKGAVYGRARLWCARFVNVILSRTGHTGTGSDMASSFAHYGHRIRGPQVGAIAVMSRRGGGHVGVVSGFDDRGNPMIISGNHGRRVAESVYSKKRVYAYVMPK